MKADSALIEIDKVRMEFAPKSGRVLALDDVSLQIRPHEFVSLLGPSGCGKSTLLLLIAGLLYPTGGEVRIRSKKLTSPFIDAAIVFQHDNLLEWRRIIDNVMLPVELRRLVYKKYSGHARELLETVGLQGFERAYPHELSGGMRQRVALCRALVCDVPVLLMDEPFGALDAMTREEHQQLLQRIWLDERKTIVFVSHDIREAVLLSDRVVVMSPRPGRVAETIEIDLPRPREPKITESVEFNSIVGRIRGRLFERETPAPIEVAT